MPPAAEGANHGWVQEAPGSLARAWVLVWIRVRPIGVVTHSLGLFQNKGHHRDPSPEKVLVSGHTCCAEGVPRLPPWFPFLSYQVPQRAHVDGSFHHEEGAILSLRESGGTRMPHDFSVVSVPPPGFREVMLIGGCRCHCPVPLLTLGLYRWTPHRQCRRCNLGCPSIGPSAGVHIPSPIISHTALKVGVMHLTRFLEESAWAQSSVTCAK
jgi:hypothetical protein